MLTSPELEMKSWEMSLVRRGGTKTNSAGSIRGLALWKNLSSMRE